MLFVPLDLVSGGPMDNLKKQPGGEPQGVPERQTNVPLRADHHFDPILMATLIFGGVLALLLVMGLIFL